MTVSDSCLQILGSKYINITINLTRASTQWTYTVFEIQNPSTTNFISERGWHWFRVRTQTISNRICIDS